MTLTATATLPRIVRFVGTTDGGPSDGRGSAVCPHCGASGRYVHFFQCEDGSRRGAMSGCIKLFPVHPIAKLDLDLKERERELQKSYGPGAKLNSWDQRIRKAIDAFYADEVDEWTTLAVIRSENVAKANYRRTKRGRW